MSISITWGLIARMDGILSAEPLMYSGAYEGEGASVCVSDVLGEVH